MQRSELMSVRVVPVLICAAVLCGCGGDPNKGINVKPTVQVTGKVLVDGEPPATPIAVKAYPSGGVNDQPPSTGSTGQDGVFTLNTYAQDDGVPSGEYKMTFLWGKPSLNRGMQGLDQLGGNYFFPEKSPFTVNVTQSDGVLDIGVFELKRAPKPAQIPDDRN